MRKPKQQISIGSTALTVRDISPSGRLIRKGTKVVIVDTNSTDGSFKALFDGRQFWLHKDDLNTKEKE